MFFVYFNWSNLEIKWCQAFCVVYFFSQYNKNQNKSFVMMDKKQIDPWSKERVVTKFTILTNTKRRKSLATNNLQSQLIALTVANLSVMSMHLNYKVIFLNRHRWAFLPHSSHSFARRSYFIIGHTAYMGLFGSKIQHAIFFSSSTQTFSGKGYKLHYNDGPFC